MRPCQKHYTPPGTVYTVAGMMIDLLAVYGQGVCVWGLYCFWRLAPQGCLDLGPRDGPRGSTRGPGNAWLRSPRTPLAPRAWRSAPGAPSPPDCGP